MRFGIFLLCGALTTSAAAVEPVLKAPEAACFLPGKRFEQHFVGNWEIQDLNVRYSVRLRGKSVCLFGRDVENDEWFEISNMTWDGVGLGATFTMRSTKWKTRSRLTLETNDSIRDEYVTSEGKKVDHWTRRVD